MSASQLPSRHAPPLPKAGRRVRGQESCDASVSRAQGNVTGPTRQSKRRVVKATTPQNGPFAHGSPGRRRSSIVCVWGRRSHNTHPPHPPAERGGVWWGMMGAEAQGALPTYWSRLLPGWGSIHTGHSSFPATAEPALNNARTEAVASAGSMPKGVAGRREPVLGSPGWHRRPRRPRVPPHK